MKRWIVVVVLALLVAVGSYSVFAQPGQGQSGQPPMGGGMNRGMMQGQGGGMGRGMMQGGMMCPMCAAMSGAMMQKSMVQTDGGIIVAMGNKLIKYDNDLNKVKEVAVDLDVSGMQQTMAQMMQNCPMHQQMMQRSQQQAQEAP